jgi:hypothetical protein
MEPFMRVRVFALKLLLITIAEIRGLENTDRVQNAISTEKTKSSGLNAARNFFLIIRTMSFDKHNQR